MPRFTTRFQSLALCGIALGCSGLWGCDFLGSGSKQNYVSASVNLIDRTSQPLSNVGSFIAVYGAYGPNCASRSDNGKWSVPVADYNGTFDAERLSVQKDDSACTLAIESLEGVVAGVRKRFIGQPVINLTESYPVGASSFTFMSNPLDFYAVSKLRSADGALFSSDFVLDVVYSNDPARVDREILDQFVYFSATAQASNVAVPIYTVDTSSLALKVDAHKQLDVNGTGNVVLTVGNQAGREYALTQTNPGTTTESIDGVYAGAATKVAITGSPVNIAPAALGLNASAQLPQTWYVIVANYNDAAPGIRSYQVFGLRFLTS